MPTVVEHDPNLDKACYSPLKSIQNIMNKNPREAEGRLELLIAAINSALTMY